jgi:hypothetical protein
VFVGITGCFAVSTEHYGVVNLFAVSLLASRLVKDESAYTSDRVNRHDFPDKKLAIESYTHNLDDLVGVAHLKAGLKAAFAADELFKANWKVVCQWSVDDRYDPDISRDDALGLYKAITKRRTGVMTWIRSQW